MSLFPDVEPAKRRSIDRATSKEWYPYRHLVERWIAGKRDPRFVLLGHPGYSRFNGSSVTGRGYASQLNRYAACVTDGLHLNYTIAKVFEMSAAGCLLLINVEMRPVLSRLGFFETVHFLTYQDASTLSDIVGLVLDPRNTQRLDDMRRRAQRIVLRRHIVTHRIAELHVGVNLLT